MFARMIQICSAFLLACALTASSSSVTLADNDGVVWVRSAYPIGETIERLKKDIADKGIKFFSEIDQSKLAAEAGIKLQPSVLLIFGNPPLGTQFITAARVRERKRRSLDGLHRLRLDRPAAWNQEPQGSIQDGFGRDRVDHLEREGKVTRARES